MLEDHTRLPATHTRTMPAYLTGLSPCATLFRGPKSSQTEITARHRDVTTERATDRAVLAVIVVRASIRHSSSSSLQRLSALSFPLTPPQSNDVPRRRRPGDA